MLIAMFASAAHAFCGTYVGPTDGSLTNEVSQVVYVQQGSHSTLTLAADYAGDASEFALLIPVPEVLGAEDVQVANAGAFAALDAYSQPRVVTYNCSRDGLWHNGANDDNAANADNACNACNACGADSDVTVEATFTAGEYELVVLSAEQSSSLLSWLDQEGYAVGAEAEELLQEYIDGGSYFLAAKVALDFAPEGGEKTHLNPLRIRYSSTDMYLPVRLGTVNADGEQELVIYAITDNGQTHIANYPEARLDTDCFWGGESEDFEDAYRQELLATMAGKDGPAWVMEYAWPLQVWCDPCVVDPPSDAQFAELGASVGVDTWLTRLHLRYAPEDAKDIQLYTSGIQETHQVRWIAGNDACGHGRCKLQTQQGCWGCSTGTPGSLGAAAMLLVLALLRRRYL